MSYFVCGRISISDSSQGVIDEVIRAAAARASEIGMVLCFGGDIRQPLVRQILRQSNASGSNTIPFLLTLPQADTSDDLVSPYVLVGKQGDDEFRRNAHLMSKLFTGLFEESKVQRVDIYVVDSYDDAVPTKSIVAQHLEAEFLDAWNKRDRDFFFCLELRRFGAILGKGSE